MDGLHETPSQPRNGIQFRTIGKKDGTIVTQITGRIEGKNKKL